MNNNIWTVIATGASAISAICSAIGIGINIYYNRKNYRANLEITSKLQLLKSVRKLVPDYITAVNYSLYLYEKGWSNENDRKAKQENRLTPGIIIGKIGLEAYDSQLTKAKIVYRELKTILKIYENKQLLEDVEKVWNILNKENLQKIKITATNAEISKEEKEINLNFKSKSDQLTDDFTKWYNMEFEKLVN